MHEHIYFNLFSVCVVEESIADSMAAVCELDRTPLPFMALMETNLTPILVWKHVPTSLTDLKQ